MAVMAGNKMALDKLVDTAATFFLGVYDSVLVFLGVGGTNFEAGSWRNDRLWLNCSIHWLWAIA